uniref:hypothetical protein n=1 Tax=Thaumasiovibrio occultus TaxID=1891184 RepID=UPI00131D71B1|nr:hypothetical protein [Thaumasiovibrio occultus]
MNNAMTPNDLLRRWAPLLAHHLQRDEASIRDNGLSSSDFDGAAIEMKFEDGSYCRFQYAFAVVNETTFEVAVFTEHCGYHVFSSDGVSVYRCEESASNAGIEKTVILACEWVD